MAINMVASMLARWHGRPAVSDVSRGSIVKRGTSFRVLVYAGLDPLTGKRVYLDASTTDEAEAKRILTRFRSQVDDQRHARTKATLRAALDGH